MIYLSFLRKLPYHLRKNGQYRAEFAVLHPFVLYSQKSEQHQAYRQQPYIAKAAASYGYGGLPEPVLLSAGIASAYRLQGKQRHWPTKITQNPVDTYQCLFRNRPELRGYVLAVIGRALVVVAGYMGNIPLMMAFTALAALGQGPWQGDMNAVIASCSEYTYLTQGKRIDGTMYSCTSLGVKIGGGMGTAVVGFVFPDIIHHYQVLTPGANKAIYLIASPFVISKFADIMQSMAPEYPIIRSEKVEQALNWNINEQKKQTVETLRQTIKEWDIARSYVVRYHFNEDATETMQEKIKRMPVTEASRMAVY